MRSDAPPTLAVRDVGLAGGDGQVRPGGDRPRAYPAAPRSAIEADLPPGVHHLVPFSIGGTGIVVGRPAAVGVTDPVRHLVVTPFATYATVSWEWPATAQLAEVSWELDGDADCVVDRQAQYRSQGGARVPLGRGPCTIEVRAVIMVGRCLVHVPAGQKVVDAVVDVAISYTVSARRAWPVRRTLEEGHLLLRRRLRRACGSGWWRCPAG